MSQKARIRDWEGDTIIGKDHEGAMVSLVERKSKYTVLEKVAAKKAGLVVDAEIRLLTPFKDSMHTITKDNGLVRQYIPNVVAHTLEHEGHYILYEHFSRILVHLKSSYS